MSLGKQITTFVFSVGIVCYSALEFPESIRKQTLCKGEEPVILHCSGDKVIWIDRTESQIHQCNKKCDAEFLEQVKKLCNGQDTCNVTSDIFPKVCNQFGRYLTIKIDCSRRWWESTKSRRLYECSNKLSQIDCHYYSNHHIHFEGVYVQSHPKCDYHIDHGCLSKTLYNLCDHKQACSEVGGESSCLFGRPSMDIFFLCSENFTQTVGNTSTEAITSVAPVASATSTMKIFTESTESIHRNASAVLVLIGSLLLVKDAELPNSSYILCADDWNDKAASVVCKFLNHSTVGKATKVTNPQNYSMVFISLSCTGEEWSLLDCAFIDKKCSSTMAAGVVCCKDEASCPNQMTSSPSQKSTGDTETSYTGLAVGLALVAVTVLLGSLVVIYLRHRGRLKFMCFDKLKKPSRYTSDNDYLGQQGISLPESSRGNARHEINNDNNENETLYENQPKHPIDSTENAQFYSLASSPEDQTQYATAKEGEYDVTNSRRHVANDGNLYDHSVDNVYDSTGNQGSNPTSDSTYARTVDNVYDGTARKRTNDRGTDGVSLGTYNHSSETAYDVRFFNKSQSNHYDA